MSDDAHEPSPALIRTVAPTESHPAPTWIAMLVLAGIVYLPAALGAGLLMFDDNFFFGPDNPEFQRGLAAVWTELIANAYLPVAHTSLYFDYWFGDGGAFLPHLHNLLLHALCGVVFARLLLQLGVSALAANVAAALFVVHPALCESVAWVSSRKYVLSGLFVLLALWQTARFCRAPTRARTLWLAVLAALAMYANATAVVLPLLAVGVVLWCGGPARRWRAPLVLLLVTLPIAWHHQSVAADQGTLVAGGLASRLPQAPGSFLHYLRTSVWPVDLNVLYPEIDTLAAFRAQATTGTIALLAFAVGGAVLAWPRRTRAIGAGLLAFAIAWLPFNTVLPASAIAAADRYLYLIVPGLALALAALLERLHRRGPWLLAVFALPLLWLAAARAHDFRDDATLWRSSLAQDDCNAVAHLNLVNDVMQAGVVAIDDVKPHLHAAVDAARYPIHELRARTWLRRLALAEADYGEAANQARAAIRAAEELVATERTEQRLAQARTHLLSAQLQAFEPLQLADDDDGAEAVLAAARLAAPDDPQVIAFDAIRALAERRPELLQLAEQGKAPRLRADDEQGSEVDARLERARTDHPRNADLWLAQALWDQARDKVTAALRAFRQATERQSDAVRAWLGAARLLREQSMFESALDYARKGWQRRPDPRLLQEVALALVGMNRLQEAEQQLAAYVQLEPDDADAKKILANLLIGRAYSLLSDANKRDQVQALVEEALRYNPNETKAHLVLGRLAHERRQYAAAVEHLETARRLVPGFAEATEQLTESLAALGYQRLLLRDDDGASDAWLRCLAVAPAEFDAEGIRGQLQMVWQRTEARGVEHLREGRIGEATADFRRMLRIDPEQHWAAWLLATALQRDPDADLDELEKLCRRAVAWQQQHDLDAGRQVYLLAATLLKRGKQDEARQLARDYLSESPADADKAVLAALLKIAGN